MNRCTKTSLGVLLTLGLIGSYGFGSSVVAGSGDRPNVIVFFTDDHGYADLTCQHSVGDIRTPNIDRLAAGGIRMDSGYVTAPQCVPSRAGLITGRYQNRFGVESNGEPLDGFNRQVTIAQRLQGAGYATGMTGKWHLGKGPEIPRHGFDYVYYKHANAPGWANFGLDGERRPAGQEDSKMYHIDVNTAAACAFIRKHRDQPFFFYCAYRAPHVPLDPPAKYTDMFPGKMPERRRKALAMVAAVDAGVGEVMATLRECGLEERTLIFLIGDNGAPLKIHKYDAPGGGPGWDGSLNDPLNGEKGMLAEGGIRVPYVVHWKGKLPGGQIYRPAVSSLDVAATAAAVAGLPQSKELDGVDLIPYLSGDRPGEPHPALYWRWIAQAACRAGKWKYLKAGSREYLFDLDADREEKRNLLAEHADIAARLKQQLADWSQDLSPPGLATKQMSAVWEQYFDYYLDGKPAPPRVARRDADDRVGGVVIRGGTGRLNQGSLVVQPAKKSKSTFVAASGFRVAAPAEATVRLQSEAVGRVGIAWREQGQRDFVREQTVMSEYKTPGEWQELTWKLPAHAPVIHMRLHLTRGTSRVDWLNVRSANGDGKKWSFGEEEEERVKGEG